MSDAVRVKPPSAWLFVVFVVAFLADMRFLHAFAPYDHRLSDFLLRLQAERHPPDPNIVLVIADDKSVDVMEEEVDRWPWPRHVFGEVGRAIAAQRPAAIIFDQTFVDHDRRDPKSDEAMSNALRGLPNVYFPLVRGDPAGDPTGVQLRALAKYAGLEPNAGPDAKANILIPRALDPALWKLGAINIFPDPADGVAREYPVTIDTHGWPLPSMPARVARDLGYRVPAEPNMILSWPDTRRKTVSFIDLYDDVRRRARGEPGVRPANEFTGKIVLIGASATGVADKHVTPRSRSDLGTDIMAVALENIIHERDLHNVPGWIVAVMGIALMSMVWFGFARGWGSPAIGLFLLVATLLLHGIAFVASEYRILYHSSSPTWFAWGLYGAMALRAFVLERRFRHRAVEQFSRFLNPVIVRELLERGGLPRVATARMVTVLFCDITGFTGIAEKLKPDALVALLNLHFSTQVEIIFRHRGTLDKFIGDAMMVVWGSPVPDPQHAEHAIACALEMQAALPAFRQSLPQELRSFDFGIGIHTGEVIAGLVGPERRLEYTAIGDTVNVAARIQTLTRGVCRILVSEDTRRFAGNAFKYVARGRFRIKGRVSEIDVFEPQEEGR